MDEVKGKKQYAMCSLPSCSSCLWTHLLVNLLQGLAMLGHCQAIEFCLGCIGPSWLPGQHEPQEWPVDPDILPVHETHVCPPLLPATLLAARLMGGLVCVGTCSLSSYCGYRQGWGYLCQLGTFVSVPYPLPKYDQNAGEEEFLTRLLHIISHLHTLAS